VLALFALLIAACSPYGPQHDVVVVVEETPEAVETEVVEIDPEQAGGNDHEQEIHGIGSQIATSEKCLEERPMYNGLTPIHNAYRYTYSFNEACARIFGFADHAEAIVANNARLAQPTA